MRTKFSRLTGVIFLALWTFLPGSEAFAQEACGDVNDDGIVTATDSLTTLEASIDAADCYLYVCDINGDGNVTATDALGMLQYAVGQPLTLACPAEATPGDEQNSRVFITNDESALASRVTLYDQDVLVDPAAAVFDGTLVTAAAKTPNYTLKLVAEVSSPVVSNQTIQATSVHKAGKEKHFVVSYNMAGATRLGALEYFDLKDPKKPKLKSQALFVDTDVSSVTDENFTTYAAEATSDPSFGAPAVLETIRNKKKKFILAGGTRIGLPSFAATSVAVTGKRLYVTSGNTGDLVVFDRKKLSELFRVTLDDLRWVDVAQHRIVAVQGTPGRLAVYDDKTFQQIAVWPFTGADIPESKSTVDVVGGKAFIAAGSAGLQVISIETGAFLGSVAMPVVPGLDPSVTVANSVSVTKKAAFISFGEAGIYLAVMTEDPAKTGSETPVSLSVLGKLQFGALQSANHVAFRGEHLIVAAGLGGLKVVEAKFLD